MGETIQTASSADHDELVAAVGEFARAELLEQDIAWDRDESSCASVLPHLSEMGLFGLRTAERFGGLGTPMRPYVHMIRELAYASPSVAVTISVHNMVCEVVERFASDVVREKVLPRLASGELSAFAISEPDAGSDPSAARTRAEPVEGGWRLSGTKLWVTNGLSGKWFAVLARTGDVGEDARPEFSMLLLDAEQAGVERQAITGKMGIRGSETAEMVLDGVFVPETHLLGGRGDGLRSALAALDGGRIGIAAQAAGIAEACLDLMARYAKQRHQFGRPIGEFQAVQWMIADSAADTAAARLLMERAADLREAGAQHTREAATAKLFASEAACRVADRAVQVHGGYGFVKECRVEQLYRDARITRIYEGTSEIQRFVIARETMRQVD